MKERSLIAFTLLCQLSVGAIVILAVIHAVLPGAGSPRYELLELGSLVCTAGMGIALLSSFLHLGTPTNAWRSLTNWRSSWLSREVVLALAFTGLCALQVVLHRMGLGSNGTTMAAIWLAAATGLALIGAMIKVYRVRTVSQWNRRATPLSFALTTAILGTFAVTAIVLINARLSPTIQRALLNGISLAALLALIGEMVFLIRQRRSRQVAPREHLEIDDQTPTALGTRLFGLRLSLLGITIAALVAALLVNQHEPLTGLLLLTAVSTGIAAELVGRIAFYEHIPTMD